MRVISFFARTGTASYLGSLARYKSMFARQMPDVEHKIIVIDNKLAPAHEENLDDNTTLIGAGGKYREFDSWSQGLKRHRNELAEYDIAAFATSAFENKPNEYLARFSTRILESIRDFNIATGRIDSSEFLEGVYSFRDIDVRHWIRTSFFLAPARIIRDMGRVLSFSDAQAIFSWNPKRPFKRDCGLSQHLQAKILTWLCGWKSNYTGRWYGCFELTHDTMPLFVSKTMAILNELLLTVSLQENGANICDVTWLEVGLENGFDEKHLPSISSQLRVNGYGLPLNAADRIKMFEPEPIAAAGARMRILFMAPHFPCREKSHKSEALHTTLEDCARMGHDVTFIPADGQDRPFYRESLRAAGVSCPIDDSSLPEADRILSSGRNPHFVIFYGYLPERQIWGELTRTGKKKLVAMYPDISAIIQGHGASANSTRDFLEHCQGVVLDNVEEYEMMQRIAPKARIFIAPQTAVHPYGDVPYWGERRGMLIAADFQFENNRISTTRICERIFPLMRKHIPSLDLFIIGKRITPEIVSFGQLPGVRILPQEQESLAFLFTRLCLVDTSGPATVEIVTSLARGVPVVASVAAAALLPGGKDKCVLEAENDQQFAERACALYLDRNAWAEASRNALSFADRHFSRAAAARRLSQLLEHIHKDA